MEPTSFAISVVTLITLFDSCIKAFELVERGKHFARDHAVLIARLDAQQEILRIWGETLGFTAGNDATFADRLLQPSTRKTIKASLECIEAIFKDVRQLQKRYGLQEVRAQPAASSHTATFTNTELQTTQRSPLLQRVLWFQKHTGIATKSRWAIRDKVKFTTMLNELSALIGDLKDITSSVAALSQQRAIFAAQVAAVTNVDDLEIIEEALSEEDPVLSDIASQHLATLTEAPATVRSTASFYTVAAPSELDDDIETHAGSDVVTRDAEAFDSASNDTGAVVAPPAETTHRSLSSLGLMTVYGHQNNLAQLQDEQCKRIKEMTGALRMGTKKTKILTTSRSCLTRIRGELRGFNPIDTPFISFGPASDEEDLSKLLGAFQGPPNTPYESGVFFVSIELPPDYPFSPPHCRMLTPVYHPNFDSQGNISANILRPGGFNAAWTIPTVLMAICSILGSPNTEEPFMPEIAAQLVNDEITFEKEARLITQKYAHRSLPPRSAMAEFAFKYPTSKAVRMEGFRARSDVEQRQERFEIEHNKWGRDELHVWMLSAVVLLIWCVSVVYSLL